MIEYSEEEKEQIGKNIAKELGLTPIRGYLYRYRLSPNYPDMSCLAMYQLFNRIGQKIDDGDYK